MAAFKEYKILKNVPLVLRSSFDASCPEYVTMMKMKVGDCFEFPATRVRWLVNSRNYIKKTEPNLSFTSTTESTIKLRKLKTGKCWRIKDGSTKNYGPHKNRKKPGKGLSLKPNP